jgi:hypothetical protein
VLQKVWYITTFFFCDFVYFLNFGIFFHPSNILGALRIKKGITITALEMEKQTKSAPPARRQPFILHLLETPSRKDKASWLLPFLFCFIIYAFGTSLTLIIFLLAY